MRHLASTSKPIHIETNGCIVNIRPGLKDWEGNSVTSIEVICDQGWRLPDLDNRPGINVRVVEIDLESPCAGCGKSPQDCICREPKIQALIDCARDVINNWESGELAAAVTELQFALNDLGYKSEVPRG